jgi:hypothetical protein
MKRQCFIEISNKELEIKNEKVQDANFFIPYF